MGVSLGGIWKALSGTATVVGVGAGALVVGDAAVFDSKHTKKIAKSVMNAVAESQKDAGVQSSFYSFYKFIEELAHFFEGLAGKNKLTDRMNAWAQRMEGKDFDAAGAGGNTPNDGNGPTTANNGPGGNGAVYGAVGAAGLVGAGLGVNQFMKGGKVAQTASTLATDGYAAMQMAQTGGLTSEAATLAKSGGFFRSGLGKLGIVGAVATGVYAGWSAFSSPAQAGELPNGAKMNTTPSGVTVPDEAPGLTHRIMVGADAVKDGLGNLAGHTLGMGTWLGNKALGIFGMDNPLPNGDTIANSLNSATDVAIYDLNPMSIFAKATTGFMKGGISGAWDAATTHYKPEQVDELDVRLHKGIAITTEFTAGAALTLATGGAAGSALGGAFAAAAGGSRIASMAGTTIALGTDLVVGSVGNDLLNKTQPTLNMGS